MFSTSFGTQLYEQTLPMVTSRRDRLEAEAKLLYVPSTSPLKNVQKFGLNDPAEDGLYVGKTNTTSCTNSRNANKLEQRLFKESGTLWFEKMLNWLPNEGLFRWTFARDIVNEDENDKNSEEPELLVYQAPITQAELALTNENIECLDPYDPENIALFESLKRYENGLRTDCKHPTDYRDDSSGMTFCSMDEALENPRIKVLLLRSQGVPCLKNVAIPLNERKIALLLADALLSLEGKDGSESKGGAKKSRARGKRGLRAAGLKVQAQIRLGSMDKPKTLSELVFEDLSGHSAFSFNFLKTTERNRPLRPVRKNVKL